MKALISLPANIVGYVIALAIFVAGILIINAFWYQFQTIPLEKPEKSTACDLAYVISIWNEITERPNIFEKSKLVAKNKQNLEDKIFENSTLFLPGADLFFGIVEDESNWNYTLYVPSESEITFDTCKKVTIAPKSYKELEKTDVSLWTFLPPIAMYEATTNFIGEAFEEAREKEYLESVTTYNEIFGVCSLPAFIKEGDEIKTGTMVAGFTSNVATWLREGIYNLLVSGEKSYYHPLGTYPVGCLNTLGFEKYEDEKPQQVEWYQPFLEFFISPLSAIGWIADKFPVIYADCEFNWNWEYDGNKFVINVTPKRPWWFLGESCKLSTRIPKSIVEEYNLTSKLCYPKRTSLLVYAPEGMEIFGAKKKYFYLKMEKLDAGFKNEDNAISYCKTRCVTEGISGLCKYWCEYGDDIFDVDCGSMVCLFAQDKIHEFYRLPRDAIDIKYIVVEEDKLEEKNWKFEDIEESEYYKYTSVCSSWPSVFECESSEQCEEGKSCIRYGVVELGDKKGIDKSCGFCSPADKDKLCSPWYLSRAPTVTQGFYTCQDVINYSAPLNLNRFSECLPAIKVSFTGPNVGCKTNPKRGDKLESEDCTIKILDIGKKKLEFEWTYYLKFYIYHEGRYCGEKKIYDGETRRYCNDGCVVSFNYPEVCLSATRINCSSHSNAKIKWKINAKNICSRTLKSYNPTKDEFETYTATTGFCPKMKFWCNIDKSKTYYLDEVASGPSYEIEIEQQVCRGNERYNNAEKVFIVADLHTEKGDMRYILPYTEIELVE